MRVRRGVLLGAALLYALTVFGLGAAHIYVGSLQVANRFDLAGTPYLLAGQPATFRVWAYSDDPPGPLREHEVVMALHGPDGEVARTRGVTAANGGVVLTLAVPDLPAGGYQGRVSVARPGATEVLEAATVDLWLEKASVQAWTETPCRSTGPDCIDVSGTHAFLPGVAAPLLVRVVAGEGALPRTVPVRVERLYGECEVGANPVHTDLFGLAELVLTVHGECVCRIEVDGGEGEASTLHVTLAPLSLPVFVDVPNPLVVDGEAVVFEVRTLGAGGKVFVDFFAQGVWLERGVFALQEGGRRQWLLGLAAPSQARTATLVVCLSDWACEESHHQATVIWSGQPLDLAGQIEVALAALDGRESGYVAAVRARLGEGQMSRLALERLRRYLLRRLDGDYVSPTVMVRTEMAAKARLQATKEAFKGGAGWLLALVLVGGALIAAVWVLRARHGDARALAEIMREDADAADDAPVLVRGGACLGRWLFVGEVALLTLSVVAFAAGVWLILQTL